MRGRRADYRNVICIESCKEEAGRVSITQSVNECGPWSLCGEGNSPRGEGEGAQHQGGRTCPRVGAVASQEGKDGLLEEAHGGTLLPPGVESCRTQTCVLAFGNKRVGSQAPHDGPD